MPGGQAACCQEFLAEAFGRLEKHALGARPGDSPHVIRVANAATSSFSAFVDEQVRHIVIVRPVAPLRTAQAQAQTQEAQARAEALCGD